MIEDGWLLFSLILALGTFALFACARMNNFLYINIFVSCYYNLLNSLASALIRFHLVVKFMKNEEGTSYQILNLTNNIK